MLLAMFSWFVVCKGINVKLTCSGAAGNRMSLTTTVEPLIASACALASPAAADTIDTISPRPILDRRKALLLKRVRNGTRSSE